MIFNLLKKIAVILLLIIITLAFPNKSKAFNLFENEDCCEIDVWDLTIDDNIKYPNLPVNVATQIKNHIHNEELHLKLNMGDLKQLNEKLWGYNVKYSNRQIISK